jgi:putative inorganic carbon (HCO3(-)) transporter
VSEPERDRRLTMAWRAAVAAVAGALPLLMWPGLGAPFSTPKHILLGSAIVALLPAAAWFAVRRRGRASVSDRVGHYVLPPALQALLVLWCASFAWSSLLAPFVSPDALFLGIAGPLWCVLVFFAADAGFRPTLAHVAGAAAMAAVAISQAAGADPIAWAGWLPQIAGASARMRAYGTMGNPNFVAALSALTIPLALGLACVPERSRRTRAVSVLAALLLAAAVGVTGSRAGAIALAAGVVVFAVVLRTPASRWLVAGAVLAAALAVAVSGGRGAAETFRGREYIWQTTWAHAWEHPVTGIGPGAFELSYAGWDDSARTSPRASQADQRFSGPQQFAHNDYLQALIERGVGGLTATVMLLATPFLVWRRFTRPNLPGRVDAAGPLGAIAACATVAGFDFPLQRPAETAALWMAVALAWQAARSTASTATHTGETTR